MQVQPEFQKIKNIGIACNATFPIWAVCMCMCVLECTEYNFSSLIIACLNRCFYFIIADIKKL